MFSTVADGQSHRNGESWLIFAKSGVEPVFAFGFGIYNKFASPFHGMREVTIELCSYLVVKIFGGNWSTGILSSL